MSVYTETRTPELLARVCPDEACIVKRVVLSGLLAGVCFGVFQMLVSAVLVGNPFAFLQLASGMVLGREALENWFPLAVSLPVGIVVHFIFAILFAGGFLLVLGSLPWRVDTRSGILVAAATYGTALWLFNFYIFGPLFGWYWFLSMTYPLLQGFVAHTIFYGVVLGLYWGHPEQ
jgi:hypothetical protein